MPYTSNDEETLPMPDPLKDKPAQHTPGPWKAGDQFCGYQFFAPHNHLVPIRGSRGYLAYVTADKFDPEHSNANARLIAAAPELLIACEAALEALSAWEEDAIEAGTWSPDDGKMSEVRKRVRAAIAKATGSV